MKRSSMIVACAALLAVALANVDIKDPPRTITNTRVVRLPGVTRTVTRTRTWTRTRTVYAKPGDGYITARGCHALVKGQNRPGRHPRGVLMARRIVRVIDGRPRLLKCAGVLCLLFAALIVTVLADSHAWSAGILAVPSAWAGAWLIGRGQTHHERVADRKLRVSDLDRSIDA